MQRERNIRTAAYLGKIEHWMYMLHGYRSYLDTEFVWALRKGGLLDYEECFVADSLIQMY